MQRSVFILCVLLFSYSYAQVPSNYARAEIYYFDFSINVRVRMNPDDVRDEYLTKLILRDRNRISAFVLSLPIDEMRPLRDEMEADVRLVIDLYSDDGVIDTYYASTAKLFDENGRNAADLAPQFAELFEIGVIVTQL